MAHEGDPTFSALAARTPAVRLTLPPLWFFKFPPASEPQTLPPPPDLPTLAHPFTIPLNIYNNFLDGRVPFTVALVYITTVTWLNSVNKSRNHKPWAFSKTQFFKLMVITHNILLAVYSAWTCVGMVNALSISFYSPRDAFGLAGTVDSLCKINGPRGVGSAATYNPTSSAWGITNRFFHLGADGLTPEVTDVGRIWNEGLAFYGWLFYLSKFYEVIDTLIIIAKGKKSSFLQTYHHAGAMVCMWAGIRYMSAPIWMFVLVNSFIHTIMYTFYLCSAVGIRLPVWFKRILTTLQITQFVVGALYAFVHLFIKYESPVSVPYLYHLGDVATAIASDASSVAATATTSASANVGAQLKKLALRAAGREGLAENVLNDHGQKFGIDAVKAVQNFVAREETRYRDELQWTHCLDTSGQAFAIYLNVLYLAPLTWLFVRFFIKSYLQRLERRRSSTTNAAAERAKLAVESYKDAKRGAGRRLSQAFEDIQGGIDENGHEIAVVDDEQFKQELREAASKTKESAVSIVESSQTQFESTKEVTSETINSFSEEVKNTVSRTEEGMSRALDDLKQKADLVKAQAENAIRADTGRNEESDGSTRSVSTSPWNSDDERTAAHKRVDELDDQPGERESSDTVETRTASLRQSASSVVDTIKDTLNTATEYSTSERRDSTAEDHDPFRDSPDDTARMIEGSPQRRASDSSDHNQDPVNTDDVEEDADKKTGSDDEQFRSRDTTDSVHDQREGGDDDDQEVDRMSPKEKVRNEDSDQRTQAEASIGVAEEDETPAGKSDTEDIKSEAATSSEEPHQKDSTIKDSGDKDGPRETNVGGEPSPEEPVEQESVAESGEAKVNDSVDTREASNSTPDSPEARQQLFHEERDEALEKLESIKSQGLEDKEEVQEPTDPHPKGLTEDDDQTGSTDKSEGHKPSFDEARAEALEKLKSAISEDRDDSQSKTGKDSAHTGAVKDSATAEEASNEPVESSEAIATDEKEEKDNFGLFDDLDDQKDVADAEPEGSNRPAIGLDNQDFEDQKDSWIDVSHDDAEENKAAKADSKSPEDTTEGKASDHTEDDPQPTEKETEIKAANVTAEDAEPLDQQQSGDDAPVAASQAATDDELPKTEQSEVQQAPSGEQDETIDEKTASHEEDRSEDVTESAPESTTHTKDAVTDPEIEGQAAPDHEAQTPRNVQSEKDDITDEATAEDSGKSESVANEVSTGNDAQEPQAEDKPQHLSATSDTNGDGDPSPQYVAEPKPHAMASSDASDKDLVELEEPQHEPTEQAEPDQDEADQDQSEQKEHEQTVAAKSKSEQDELKQAESEQAEPKQVEPEQIEPKQTELKEDESQQGTASDQGILEGQDNSVDNEDKSDDKADSRENDSDQPTFAEVVAHKTESAKPESSIPDSTEVDQDSPQVSTIEASSTAPTKPEQEKDEHTSDDKTPSKFASGDTEPEAENNISTQADDQAVEMPATKKISSDNNIESSTEQKGAVVSEEHVEAAEKEDSKDDLNAEGPAEDDSHVDADDATESVEGEDSFVKITADGTEEGAATESTKPQNTDAALTVEEQDKTNVNAAKDAGEVEGSEEDAASIDDSVDTTATEADTPNPGAMDNESTAESVKDSQGNLKGEHASASATTEHTDPPSTSAEQAQNDSATGDEQQPATADQNTAKTSLASATFVEDEQEPSKKKTDLDQTPEQLEDQKSEAPEWFEKLTVAIDSHPETAPDEINESAVGIANSESVDQELKPHETEKEDKDVTADQMEAKGQSQEAVTGHEDPKEDTEADCALQRPPSSPSSPSLRWHQRRRGNLRESKRSVSEQSLDWMRYYG